jgi:hypothetical protein
MEKKLPTISDIPSPPDNAVFSLQNIETVVFPHPYCITPKHLEYCESGILDNYSIKHAESKGAKCETCKELVKRGRQDKILKVDEHESSLTLFIVVPQNKDLNAVEGLHAYLLSIKDLATELGIEGFAFPTATQST